MSVCLRCMLILSVGVLTAAAQLPQTQPFYLPGQPSVLFPQAENTKTNLMTMGLRVSTDFDDNALSSQQDRRPDLATFIEPHLGWHVSGALVDWTTDYTLGFNRSLEFTAHDSLSHLLDSAVQVRLTKRLRVRLGEAYLSTTNPFDQLQSFESATGLGSRILPSAVATITPADVRTEHSSTDISYALSAHSTFGVAGEYFAARYSLPSSTLLSDQVLQDSSSVTGRAYYMRQIERNQWIGVDYRAEKTIFSSGQSWSMVHSLAYTHTIAVLKLVTVSFFVGPERSVAETAAGMFGSSSLILTGAQSSWHLSEGVSGRWSGKRTNADANFSRRIDASGLLGAAQLTTVSAEVRRQLAPQWTGKLLASYQQGHALIGPAKLTNSWAAASLTHTFGPVLSLEIQYWRMHMSSNGSLPAGLLADHNRVSIALVFERKRAIGR